MVCNVCNKQIKKGSLQYLITTTPFRERGAKESSVLFGKKKSKVFCANCILNLPKYTRIDKTLLLLNW